MLSCVSVVPCAGGVLACCVDAKVLAPRASLGCGVGGSISDCVVVMWGVLLMFVVGVVYCVLVIGCIGVVCVWGCAGRAVLSISDECVCVRVLLVILFGMTLNFVGAPFSVGVVARASALCECIACRILMRRRLGLKFPMICGES